MVEMLLDERQVFLRDDGKFVFRISQTQLYDPEARENMLKEWQARIADMGKWLADFDLKLAEAIKQTTLAMENGKAKVQADIANFKEAIKIWSDIKKEPLTNKLTL